MTDKAVKRAIEILKVASDFIRENASSAIVHYDDADCDGYCLADDCMSAVEGLNDMASEAVCKVDASYGDNGMLLAAFKANSLPVGTHLFAAPPAPIPAGWEYNIDECPILDHSYALLRSGEVKVVWRKGNGDFDYFRFREIEAWMPLQKPDAPPPEATHEHD